MLFAVEVAARDLRQKMIIVRAEDEVHVRILGPGACPDRAGRRSPRRRSQAGVYFSEPGGAPDRKTVYPRILPRTAQVLTIDDLAVLRPLGLARSGGRETSGDPLRIILVHLAAERMDIKFQAVMSFMDRIGSREMDPMADRGLPRTGLKGFLRRFRRHSRT